MKLQRRWWRRSKDLNCREVGQVLHSYLDGELDETDRLLVVQHLERCRECGLEAGTYERIKAALAKPTSEAVDPAVLDRLRTFGSALTADE